MCNNNWDFIINNECKYYTKHLETIREYIGCLYSIDDCSSGGICHVVVDDNNIDDRHIQWLISECNKPENNAREEIGIAKLIADELNKITVQQRALLFSSFYTYIPCDRDCELCEIEKGEIME